MCCFFTEIYLIHLDTRFFKLLGDVEMDLFTSSKCPQHPSAPPLPFSRPGRGVEGDQPCREPRWGQPSASVWKVKGRKRRRWMQRKRQGRMAAALPIFTCNWCSLLRDYMLYMLKIYCAIRIPSIWLRIPSIWLAFIDLPSFALDALVAFRILSIILYLRAEVSETGKMD